MLFGRAIVTEVSKKTFLFKKCPLESCPKIKLPFQKCFFQDSKNKKFPFKKYPLERCRKIKRPHSKNTAWRAV
jgi:hypothetical protein